MKVISISKVKDYKEKDIQVNGWVYSTRRSGKIGFLSIRDGSGILQCIVEKASVGDELFELFKSLTQESSLTVFMAKSTEFMHITTIHRYNSLLRGI